jgi:uncharacterized membrane protein
MNIEDLKGLMDEFDPASLLPELDGILDGIVSLARMAVMVGPILLLAAGLAYLLLAPKEANYTFGYRCAFGMGSVEAWRFTQRLAGIVWSVLGLVLSIVMRAKTGNFIDMEISQMLWQAVKCLIWETGIVAVSCLVINTVVMARFTYSGEYRKDRVGK